MKHICILLQAQAALLSAVFTVAEARRCEVASPDGAILLTVDDSDPGALSIALDHKGRRVLSPSRIALDADGLAAPSRIKSSKVRKGLSETIDAPFYRQERIEMAWNSMDVKLDNGSAVEFRVYDDGVAWRHRLPARRDTMTVAGETVQLAFPGDPMTWLTYTHNEKNPMALDFQNTYSEVPLSEAKGSLSFLPLTVDGGEGVKLTVLESDLRSYPGMWMRPDSASRTLNAEFAPMPATFDYYPWRRQRYVTSTEPYIAKTAAGHSMPWRIIAVTESDTDMPVNDLVYALAEPSRVNDTSWIRPGKVAWDWWNDWRITGVPFEAGINTDTYKYYIDFAAANGIETVVLDEGWYNPSSGDMLTVIPAIDLPELVEYGRSKGVSIVLWTVFNVLDDRLEETCAKYADMGVAGFKVDFLDRDDAEAVDMTRRIAEACARHHLTLDYHGIYKPVGLNRTYPNVLNFEGLFGMEEVKWMSDKTDMPRYDVTFPYIRMMAGQVDYTPGAMRNATQRDWRAVFSQPMSMGTRCHQTATYIVYDSPFTMLCDAPSNYRGEEEWVGFVAGLPVVFDETRVVDGVMGEYIVTARRSGGSWYVGGMTNWTPRDIELDFAFLPAGQSFKVTAMVDGANASRTATDYTVRTDTVDSNSRMNISMAPGGGFAMRIEPVANVRAEVMPIPADKRAAIDPFYGKYIDCDGLYAVASPRVSDEALGVAADIIGHMLLKRPDIRQHMASRGAHVLIIGKDEATCDIPEYKHVCTEDPDSIAYINWRARGFGGAPEDELSAGCGEENLLALPGDKYTGENILIHEFAHLIHMLGICGVEPDFQQRLEALWQKARDNGLWKDTYAISCPEEYFAEAVQSFFNCNRFSDTPDGVHNHVNRRAKLRAYDPDMYALLSEYFNETDIPIRNNIHP